MSPGPALLLSETSRPKGGVISLTLYATKTATATTTSKLSLLTSTTVTTHTATPGTPGTTWHILGLVVSGGNGTPSEPAPNGKGAVWAVTTLVGKQIKNGSWSVRTKVHWSTSLSTSTGVLHARLYRKNGSTYTQLTKTGVATDLTVSASLTGTAATFTLTGTLDATTFTTGTKLYMDLLYHFTSHSYTGAPTIRVGVGGANLRIITPGYQV